MKKKIKNIFIVILIIIIVSAIFIISSLLKFKNMEKEVLNSGKRYYEINTSKLPTGKKIRTLSLKKIYDDDYFNNDFKILLSDKKCNLENSFVKVRQKSNQYQYDVYLECGIFKSKIDHEGPVITLNGKDSITIYRGEKYKELGIKSVIDDSDGKIDKKEVVIDSSKVNVNKTGTYQVTYTIKDSLDNKTIKVREVKVIETLNHIVEKDTNKKNIYKGNQSNNYLLLDGILFKILGINQDKSVKVVSNDGLAAVDYKNIDSWLNDYFYEKLSNSTKDYIKKDSKWCIDNVKDPSKYSKCTKYSDKNPVGLPSILDYYNSKNDNNEFNLSIGSLVYNKKDSNTGYYYNDFKKSFVEVPLTNNEIIIPTINIIKDATVVKGDGSATNPYILKGTYQKIKPGTSVKKVKVGSYISYSGYSWRVIGVEEDETTKIIMDYVVSNGSENYYTSFCNSETINFNPTQKQNIGYALANNISEYIKTNLFVNRKTNYPKYETVIGYKQKVKDNYYKLKLNLPSMYDLFSTTIKEDYWFKDYSKNQYCYMDYQGIVICNKFNSNDIKALRLVANLDKNVTIESGDGTSLNPYEIAK